MYLKRKYRMLMKNNKVKIKMVKYINLNNITFLNYYIKILFKYFQSKISNNRIL